MWGRATNHQQQVKSIDDERYPTCGAGQQINQYADSINDERYSTCGVTNHRLADQSTTRDI